MPFGFYGGGIGGNGYGSAIPFQRIVEPQQLGMFLNLEQAELMRIARYAEAQRFYLGRHWNFKREDGEPLVTVNLIRKLVDKSVEWLMGKGFTIKVPDALVEVTLPFLGEVWEYNNYEQLAFDIGTMGAISGDVFVLITYQEPTPMQKRVNPFSQGKIKINLLNSEQVFPTWDPLNHEILTSVRIETIFYAERGLARVDRDDRANHTGRSLNTKRFTQIITPEQIVEQFQGEMPVTRPNLLGEIPLVHIKNISMPKEYYGLSDMQDLIDLQREYNEKATDISDVINYQGSPVTVIFGAKAKNLERGPKQVWSGLPADARVEQLQLQGDLGANIAYLDRVKRHMHELADVPEGSLGQMQPISNTSGVALSMTYQPLQSKTQKKRVPYGRGFEQINYFIIRIGQIMGLINVPFDLCKKCGGRIVQKVTTDKTWVWIPDAESPQGGKYEQQFVVKKQCYEIDKATLDFMNPWEKRIKFQREYGFGKEIREAPYWMIEREMKTGQSSFWDYAADELKKRQAYADQLQQHQDESHQIGKENAANPEPHGEVDTVGKPLRQNPQASPPPLPPVPKITLLPDQFIDIPEEPEEVTFVQEYLHPQTGEVVQQQAFKGYFIPTGCQNSSFLNPFENEVGFADALPKDESLEAQKFMVYQQNGWIDATWARENIPEIQPDAKELEKRMKSAAQVAPQNPSGGFQENAPPSETGANGNPTPNQGQADQQQQGAEAAGNKPPQPGK